MSSTSQGLTVILVGGQMTVDDGTVIDSRQAITDDARSEIALRSLTASMFWWNTVSSIVLPILSNEGTDAFALVIGGRTVLELRSDGSTRRSRLRQLLSGGTTTVEILRTEMGGTLPEGYDKVETLRNWNEVDMGTIGVKRGAWGKRWWFLNGNDYYLDHAGPTIAPSVIVDTSPWIIYDPDYERVSYQHLEQSRPFSDMAVLVVPHTAAAETFFRGYADWIAASRPPPDLHEWQPPEISQYDPDAPPDPLRYTTLIPIRGDFGVTGLVRDGTWQDPSGLEAARKLLEARYDYTIGIWDLADNPTLRQTLLDVVPVEIAPIAEASVPVEAASRAMSSVDKVMTQRQNEREALTRIVSLSAPLEALGWEVGSRATNPVLVLPLTEPIERYPGGGADPLVMLQMAVEKRSTSIRVFQLLYNQLDISEYVEKRLARLEEIASPAELGSEKPTPASKTLWHAPGGWADEEIDWHERMRVLARCTEAWVETFTEFAAACRRVSADLSIQVPQSTTISVEIRLDGTGP